MIDLQSCDNQQEAITFILPKILSDSPDCFVFVIRSNATDKSFQTRLTGILEEQAVRPIVVNFYNRIERTENFYVIDRSKTRTKTNKTLEYAMDFIESVAAFDHEVDGDDFPKNRSELLKEAMTNGCTLCINFLQLIDYRYTWYLQIYEDQIEDLKCDSDCFKALLDIPSDFDFNSSYSKFYNLIFSYYITQLRHSSVTDVDESLSLEDYVEFNDFKIDMEGLAALAWKEQEFQIFEFLMHLDLPFPQNFLDDRKLKLPKSPYIKSLENYIEELESLHRHIRKGNLKRVQMFMTQNPHLVFARNLNNKSALKAAFDSNQMEIFSYLKSQGMSFMDVREVGEYYYVKKKYNNVKRKQFRQFNMKFVKPALELDLITKLMEKSVFIHDHHIKNENDIRTAIKSSYQAMETTAKEILEIVAASSRLKIYFEFRRASLGEFDPYSENTHGVSYNYYDFVFIGAKDLLSDDVEKKNFALGTIVHELFHYAIHQIYLNNVSPYDERDYERKTIYIDIYEKYRELKDEDIVISTAYDGVNDENHYGELAARVPDVLLTYQHNETYLAELKEKFKDLFKFYDQYILADMRDFIPTVHAREKVREINDWLYLASEIESYSDGNVEATETDDNDSSDDVDDENTIDDSKKDKNKENKIEEDEEDMSEVIDIEEFLKEDTSQRLKVVIASSPKLILQKLYFKLRKSKTLAIYADSTFSYYENFDQVLYQIDTIRPSISLIIYCDNVQPLKRFMKIMQKTTFRKIVVVGDEREFKKKAKSKLVKQWIEDTRF